MRLHVLSLPHTSTTKEYAPCAYTQKVFNFCKMMLAEGHEVYLYAGPQNTAPCTEHIVIMTAADQKLFFGHNNWKQDFFDLKWSSKEPYWELFNMKAAAAIRERMKPFDVVCVSAGNCNGPLLAALCGKDAPPHLTCEPFVGYEGVITQNRVFESYAHMHYVYGKNNFANGFDMDDVIPNYYDVSEFEPELDYDKRGDYCLYIGRMNNRKGVMTAVEATKFAGKKLKIAGQGVLSIEGQKITTRDFVIDEPHVEHIGVLGVAERSDAMRRAQCVLVPTRYIGPFEGVHVEAMLCGTPVITTDWGVFPETVQDRRDGYRCRSMAEFVMGINSAFAGEFEHVEIADSAMRRFGLDVTAPRFSTYFDRISRLFGEGWYDLSYKRREARVGVDA